MDEKRIEWEGDSYQVICGFPELARRDAGFQLGLIQAGRKPIDWKPMPSIGAGVQEIRINAGGAYRIIYIAKYLEAIYVLHAFIKKTQETSRHDIDKGKERYKKLLEHRNER